MAGGVENDPGLQSNFSSSCCSSGQTFLRTHIQTVYKHTNSFSFSLWNMMCRRQGHGEDFPTKSRVFCHFSLALPPALTSDTNHFYREQICTLIKIYRFVVFCCFTLCLVMRCFLFYLFFSFYVQSRFNFTLHFTPFFPLEFLTLFSHLPGRWNTVEARPQWLPVVSVLERPLGSSSSRRLWGRGWQQT